MTNEQEAVSIKGGGGPREYMTDFAKGRHDLNCQSCGFNMRRDPDFGTDANGDMTSQYCSVCYQDGKFRHEASTPDAFLDAAVEELAAWRKQTTGKLKLQLKKELKRLPRWS
jgi:hypothetical protein